MVKLHCVREKKETETGPGSKRYERAENGKLMLKSTYKNCGITKTKFVRQGNLQTRLKGWAF